jgi:hypothetical protein
MRPSQGEISVRRLIMNRLLILLVLIVVDRPPDYQLCIQDGDGTYDRFCQMLIIEISIYYR